MPESGPGAIRWRHVSRQANLLLARPLSGYDVSVRQVSWKAETVATITNNPAGKDLPARTARDLAEYATTVVWTSDIHGVCTCIHSDAPEKVPSGSVYRQSDWLDLVHPEDYARLTPSFREAMEKRTGYQFEYRIARGDGTWRWMRSSAVPRFDDSGNFSGYAGAITESTELRDAVLRHAKSEVTLRLVMENSSDIISHHAPDTGNYLYASPSSERLLGYTPDELTGRSAY